MSSGSSLTIYDYSSLSVAAIQTVASVVGAALQGPFRGSNGAATYQKHIIYSAIRTFTRNATTRQMQLLSPSTVEVYRAFVKNQKITPWETNLEDGTICCWLGPEKSEKVLLFFHGGGYNLSASPGHFKLLLNALHKVQQRSGSLSICILAYDLAPSKSYPSQLESAIHAYNVLTTLMGFAPSQVLAAGDSAGGNLALGLLSHVTHPRPDLTPVGAREQGNIGGIFVISPWVTFDQTSKSMQQNQYKDCLDRTALSGWSRAFMGDARVDEYNTPLSASPEWWRSTKANSFIITAGQDEVFVDDIEDLANKIQTHFPTAKFIKSPGEAHDAPVIDLVSGFPEGMASEAFYEWILANCPY